MSQYIQNIQSVAEFEALTSQKERPVVVDFWAPWCGPCRVLGPVLEEVAQTVGAGALVAKVNVDEVPELAKAHQVSSIPTLLFYENGQFTNRKSGFVAKESLLAELNLGVGV